MKIVLRMDARQFHSGLFKAARSLIPPGAKVVCAVSGGADSTAMLHGLCAVNGLRDRRWLLSVAHLDHRIRADSGDCAAFVCKMADDLGLECQVESVDVPAIVKTEGGSMEEAARRVRYDFLRRAAKQAEAGFVSVGHHSDDQAETVLHRIIRGTGLDGLGGMRVSRPLAEGCDIQLVRPMLRFRRDEVREYLSHRGLSFREDATNADAEAATRNRLRHELIPLLQREYNPQFAEAVVRLADQAADASHALKNIAAEILSDIRVESPAGEVRVRASSLARFPQALRAQVVRLALEEIGAGLGAVGQERTNAAAELACRDRQLRIVELPGGVYVERRGDFWSVRSNKHRPRSSSEYSPQVEPLHP